jgi:phosphatidylglycerophosphatase A
MSLAGNISTLCGIGRLKPGPGTWGSFAALPAAVVIGRTFGSLGLMAATVGIFALGSWAAGKYEQETGAHDPSEVVIDEVAGQWISCVPLIYWGIDWWGWLVAFGLFRVFDIVKPGPIATLDQKFPGGIGTMIDDIAAGICAAVVLSIIIQMSFQ